MQECFLKRRVAMPAELSRWQPVTPNQLQAPVAKLKVARYCIRFPFKLNLHCGPETNSSPGNQCGRAPLRAEKRDRVTLTATTGAADNLSDSCLLLSGEQRRDKRQETGPAPSLFPSEPCTKRCERSDERITSCRSAMPSVGVCSTN